MFGLASGFYASYFSPPTVSILVIGCDGAGKTALLERCKATDFPKKISPPNSSKTTGGGGGISLQCRGGRNKRSGSGREGSGRSLTVDTSVSAGSETKKSTSSASSSMTKRRPISTKGAASAADKAGAATVGASAGSRNTTTTKAAGGPAAPSSEAERLLAEAERRLPPEKRAEVAAARASDRATSNGARNNPREQNGGSGSSAVTPPPSSGRAMLPLSKIRPTVGMNLAKLDMFGAKCHLWDLGGRPMMRPLWERYYPDCDAVVFVVDGTLLSRASTGYDDFLNPHRTGDGDCGNNGDGDDDGVDRFGETREVFEGVRREGMLADVPILAFVNKADEVTAAEEDVRRTARRSLFQRGGRPGGRSFNEGDLHYMDDEEADEVDDEEDLIRVLVGSAKTGAGVTVAMEWLVRVAIANRPR